MKKSSVKLEADWNLTRENLSRQSLHASVSSENCERKCFKSSNYFLKSRFYDLKYFSRIIIEGKKVHISSNEVEREQSLKNVTSSSAQYDLKIFDNFSFQAYLYRPS